MGLTLRWGSATEKGRATNSRYTDLNGKEEQMEKYTMVKIYTALLPSGNKFIQGNDLKALITS